MDVSFAASVPKSDAIRVASLRLHPHGVSDDGILLLLIIIVLFRYEGKYNESCINCSIDDNVVDHFVRANHELVSSVGLDHFRRGSAISGKHAAEKYVERSARAVDPWCKMVIDAVGRVEWFVATR